MKPERNSASQGSLFCFLSVSKSCEFAFLAHLWASNKFQIIIAIRASIRPIEIRISHLGMSHDQVDKLKRIICVSIRMMPRNTLPAYICPIPAKQSESTTASQGSLEKL